MLLALIAIVIGWIMVMSFLLTPTNLYSNAWDRVTKAKYRGDKDSLQIMLDHLRSFPDQWSISRDSASFPKEGAKQIYLNFEKDTGWNYTLSSFGGRPRPLNGHYGVQFTQELALQNNNREKVALIRNFYPDLDGPLMIGNSK